MSTDDKASTVQGEVMPWPWDKFPEDFSTWGVCVARYKATTTEQFWKSMAYAKLGVVRDRMAASDVAVVQKFLEA